MKLYDAYMEAIKDQDDVTERGEFSSDTDLKTDMVDEIGIAMREVREAWRKNPTAVEILKPIFGCVAFWFLLGIRVGKILRDAEIARHANG